MSLNLKSLDLICLLMVIAIAMASAFSVFKYSTGQQRKARLDNSIYSRNLNKLKQAETSLKWIETTLKNAQSQSRNLTESISKPGQIGAFLKELDLRIKRRKITLITLEPLPGQPAGQFTKIPVRLLFKGAFVDIYHLLYDLETMNRVLVTKMLTITKAGSDEQCRGELILDIFER